MDVRNDRDENDQSYRSGYGMFSSDKGNIIKVSDKSYIAIKPKVIL